METGIKFKQIMGRSMLIFLGIMLALTILSKTIYTFLLPVVKVQEVEKGKIETKLIVDGKVGPDEKFIEKKQFKVEAPLEGKVADCQIEEGGKVQKGEVLFTLEEEQSEASLLKKELEHTKLLLEQESLDRQKQALEVERGKTQEAYQKQQDKISQVAEDAELIALQEAIQKQEQEVNLNEALYAIGAVSQEAYETSQNKREELKRKVEQLTQVKIENLEKELEALQAKETTLVNQQMEIDKQSILNNHQLQVEEVDTGKRVVTAPISGYIQTLHTFEQDQVDKKEILAVIVPEDIPYRVSFEVSKVQAEKIKVGDKVKWTLERRKRDAEVIQKTLNQEKGAYTFTCEIEDMEEMPQEVVQQDGTAYKSVLIEVVQASGPYEQIVPNSAIVKQEGQNYIFVMEKQEGTWGTTYKVSKINCTLLKEGDLNTAITAIVPTGAKVVVRTSKPLKEGMEVSLE